MTRNQRDRTTNRRKENRDRTTTEYVTTKQTTNGEEGEKRERRGGGRGREQRGKQEKGKRKRTRRPCAPQLTYQWSERTNGGGVCGGRWVVAVIARRICRRRGHRRDPRSTTEQGGGGPSRTSTLTVPTSYHHHRRHCHHRHHRRTNGAFVVDCLCDGRRCSRRLRLVAALLRVSARWDRRSFDWATPERRISVDAEAARAQTPSGHASLSSAAVVADALAAASDDARDQVSGFLLWLKPIDRSRSGRSNAAAPAAR